MNITELVDPLLTKLQTWLTEFIALLPNLIIAIVVLVVAVFMARWVRKGVRHLMERVSNYSSVNSLVATVGRIAVLSAGVLVALGVVGLDGVVTGLVAGVGVAGLALGFAFQDIAANFISGFMLAIRRPIREGEIIETNDYLGQVEEINLRTTIIDTFQGQRVIVPNKEVLQNPLINYSQRKKRRIDLSCGVAYGDDLEKAEELALQTVRAIEYRDDSKDVDLYYNEFGDSSVNFVIRFWVNFSKQTDYLRAQSDSIKRLKRAYDDAGITIPFPIRTLDFGVVGGEKLNEVLPRSMYRENGEGGPGTNTESKPASDPPAQPSPEPPSQP
jgi:small conductance mechanosensitive channel